MSFDVDELAGNLRAMRAKRGVSQKVAAAEAGVEEASLSNYEQGKTKGGMNYETAWKLADYYGVSIDELGGRMAEVGRSR